MPKFFVSPNDVQENFLVLTGENAAHAKVLRLQCGETVTVCAAERFRTNKKDTLKRVFFIGARDET